MAATHQTPSCHWANLALAAPLHALVRWARVAEERAALREMPSDRLEDIGLTHREVEWEARRPFWQASRDA